MAAQEFNCPNCGAPLDVAGSSSATMRCPYCDTSVIVPVEMRRADKETQATSTPRVQSTRITIEQQETAAAAQKRTSCLAVIILAGVLLLAGSIFAVSALMNTRSTTLKSGGDEQSYLAPTRVPLATPVPVSTLTPTPGYARLVTTFGTKGIGPGLLNDARYITVDGAGTVYTADYQGGRIQAFDPDGKFLHGWQVGNAKTIIYGLTASLGGTVYVSYQGDIHRFAGSSGKALGKLEYELGQEFGDLTALPDGGVLAAWYEGRWGMITSLEGHRDDLVWFDAEGKYLRRLESAISGQTGDLALDTTLAVDGLGNVYALDEHARVVFKFSSQGKFVDRISLESPVPNQSLWVDCIAIDGQGRVYVGGSLQVSIFSPEGQFILSFPTEHSVRSMAFNVPGDLYTISGDMVSRYALGELP